jgi:serine/threonine-protein kinase
LLEDGEHFGKYQIVRWIARGGMSEVYEAVHTGLKKPVALKVLRGELSENTEARDRFALEGNNAALVRHPNVVDVSDVGVVDELPFLVMELLEGESLGDVLTRIGSMPVSDAVDLLLPVTAAVSMAHEHGVIHRDLKPDNIFLQYEGPRIVPKVLDFGASRVMHHGRLTVTASVLGTPHYMSPEQARGETSTDARSDQHALGVILYEAVVGCLPRDSSDPLELLHQVAYGPFKRPSEHMQLPDGLEAVIVRAMAREPSERFSTTRDFGLALLPFASEASRQYWSLELRYPSARRSVDIAQPAVSSRRFTPGRGTPPLASDGSDAADLLVSLPETGNRMLPSSRPPPPLRLPEGRASHADNPILDARRSSRTKLLVGGAIAATALLAWLVVGGRNGSAREESAVAARAASPSQPAAAPVAPPETAAVTASATAAAPESSSASRAAHASRRVYAPPPKKPEPAAVEPPTVRPVATREPSPKVRMIEDSKPKVEVIE